MPSPELLAQAALFVALRDQPVVDKPNTSPWASLYARRFGSDVYHRIVQFNLEHGEETKPFRVHVYSTDIGSFDVEVEGVDGASNTKFGSVKASLASSTQLSSTIENQKRVTTIVSQRPPPDVPASHAPNTAERMHIFHSEGQKTTLVIPPPNWLLSLGGEVLDAAKKGVRAPMPSVVVEVKVNVGDKVKKGQVVVVLESMKTETVLRAETDGVVSSVGCKKGEMVPEGKELVEIDTE